MDLIRLTAFVALYFAMACNAIGTKKDSEWWIQCKPMENIITEISKSDKFNASAVDRIFRKKKELPDCSDGFYGEGMSDIVVKSLSADFANLVKFALADKDLSNFLAEHIDPTTDWSDLDKITALAKTKCPKGAEEYCLRLMEVSRKSAEQAKEAAK